MTKAEQPAPRRPSAKAKATGAKATKATSGGDGPAATDPTQRPAKDPAVLEAAWAELVRANREQAERFRETQAGDFYAPVSSLFVADPRRTGEPALEVLAEQAGSNETWLDIGAGAGRYALPLALRVKEVIAVEPSAGMRRALRTGMDEHGITNLRLVPGAWPAAADELGELPTADVALIAHVGYDIEAIGPFLDAMEHATRHRCLAMLTDRSPASVADPFWPLVHGEERVALPALPDLLELLLARGREPVVTVVERSPRSFESVSALTAFLRRQLFIAEGGEKDVHFRAILPDHIARRDGAWTLANPPQGSLGIVTWRVGKGTAA
jgi:SAM-dependent methyltransferase